MKDSREKFIHKFLCSQTNTQVLNKEKKLYFLLFHEDLYSLIFQNAESVFAFSNPVVPKRNSKKHHRGSFLTVKYIISSLHSNKFSDLKGLFFVHTKSQRLENDENSLESKKKIFSHIILESLAFLLLCTQQKNLRTGNSFGKNSHLCISIHKPLEFFEKRWQDSSLAFEGFSDFLFHPEVLVRILRKNFHDISFFHLIRKILHSNNSLYPFKIFFKDYPSKKLINLLWNFYVLELDNFFVRDCEQYCQFDKWNCASLDYSLSFSQKMKDWTKYKEESKNLFEFRVDKIISSSFLQPPDDEFRNSLYGSKNECENRRPMSFLVHVNTYNYLRTNTDWIVFFQKEKSLIFLIKRRILLFLVRRLGCVFQKRRLNLPIKFLRFREKEIRCFFLAHFLEFHSKRDFYKINTKIFFLTDCLVTRAVSFINPFYLIVLILEKQNFCNSFGSPLSKSGWVLWTDSEIIQQFTRIQNNLLLFYSGCLNTKDLSRLQYILHLSCAKTLACKHKTNIRQIFKKFVPSRSNFSTFPLFGLEKNQSKNYRLRCLYQKQKNNRFWNLQLTQIDSILLHLEDFYRTL